MKRNMSLIMVFLFGCATAKVVEYVSFQDAVAKTGKKCHYLSTWLSDVDTSLHDSMISYSEKGDALIKKGFKVKNITSYGNVGAALWEKCK